MTEEMQTYLNAQLSVAATPEEISRALVSSMKALIDCQRKTAERVKEMRVERDRETQRREGAKWLWGVLSSLASAGGGAVILKLLSMHP